jgi:hypothetical protein
MNVITSFKEKKREKEVTYELKMLRELSLEQLRKRVHEYFGVFFRTHRIFPSSIEDGCIDIAIEAFLLGASYSRFGYHGEPMTTVKRRCIKEEKYLVDTLFDVLCFWGNIDDGLINESLYYTCEYYVASWWAEGFEKGRKRWRLKLK